MPVSADRCPHCARPSLFPNVEHASAANEIAALDARYAAAIATTAANGTGSIANLLEQEALIRSRVVISRDSSEVYRLACSDNQLYTTFYNLVEAGFRVPTDSKWDDNRQAIDTKLFPYYASQIRFGALTLDDRGLAHFGDCHLLLKTHMIDFRTTAFTENSAAYVMRNKEVSSGHRATWDGRGRLVVAKLASALTGSTSAADLPELLKSDGATADDDVFVEAHVYGSISIRTVEQVTLNRKKARAIRVAALKEKLGRMNVPFVSF